jgi:hypothetical protein
MTSVVAESNTRELGWPGWADAITADLWGAHVTQGQGLLGTGILPGLLPVGWRNSS